MNLINIILRPATMEYILSDSIFIKFKRRQNSSLVLEVKILSTSERREDYLLEESMKEASRILFLGKFDEHIGIFIVDICTQLVIYTHICVYEKNIF